VGHLVALAGSIPVEATFPYRGNSTSKPLCSAGRAETKEQDFRRHKFPEPLPALREVAFFVMIVVRGFKMYRRVPNSQDEIDDIVHRHTHEHETASAISRQYNCARESIVKLLKKQGVYRPIGTRKYFFNEHYFAEIDTARKAYWLGLFYADGNVHNHTLDISLERKDRYILESLASDVEYDGDIVNYKRETHIMEQEKLSTSHMSRLCLCSKKLTEDLIDKGVLSNKMYRVQMPSASKLPKHLIRHFVRGLFDGDGYISIGKNRSTKAVVWGIVGQEKLLKSVRQEISKLDIRAPNFFQKGEDNCWDLRYATSITSRYRKENTRLDDLLTIREWLYEDACIYFERKRKKFDILAPALELSGLSIDEAAEIIGIGKSTLAQLSNREKMGISSYKEGPFLRFDKKEVERIAKIVSTTTSKKRPWHEPRTGENNSSARLTEKKVREIRKKYKSGDNIMQLASQYDVGTSSIWRVVSYETWKHI